MGRYNRCNRCNPKNQSPSISSLLIGGAKTRLQRLQKRMLQYVSSGGRTPPDERYWSPKGVGKSNGTKRV